MPIIKTFEPEPKGRGTISLLWQCLSTVFLCVFTVLHLNCPLRPMTKSQKYSTYAMLILCCLIAPEFLVFRAVIERSKVSQIRSRWNSRISQIAEQTLEKLPSKQAFVLLYLDDWMRRKVSTKQAFVLLYCGMLITWEENDQTFYVDFDKLNRHLGDVGPRLLKIYSDCIPSDDEIDARGKANPLTKIVTCSQIFWVSVQVLGRLAEHMTVSLPEVVTVGFTSLTLVDYICWFSKPYNVEAPFKVDLKHMDSDFPSYLSAYDMDLFRKTLSTYESAGGSSSETFKLDWGFRSSFALSIPGCVLGALHVGAWDYPFPTIIEKWLWRIIAIVITALPVVLVGLMEFSKDVRADKAVNLVVDQRSRQYYGEKGVKWAVIVLYISMRLYVIVDAFVTLRAVPADVYQTVDWSSYLPHIGS